MDADATSELALKEMFLDDVAMYGRNYVQACVLSLLLRTKSNRANPMRHVALLIHVS